MALGVGNWIGDGPEIGSAVSASTTFGSQEKDDPKICEGQAACSWLGIACIKACKPQSLGCPEQKTACFQITCRPAYDHIVLAVIGNDAAHSLLSPLELAAYLMSRYEQHHRLEAAHPKDALTF